MESFLKDPDMKEAVDEFLEESRTLIEECEEALDEFEDNEDPKQFEVYGQKIDRIMGAAKSLGAEKTGAISEFGKSIGYKASQVQDSDLHQIVLAFLQDSNEVMTTLLDQIEKTQEESSNLDRFIKRLEWLQDKFSHIERGSVAAEDESVMSAEDLKKILSKL
jgi:chemotaxis protein histidine kinase CheA